MRLSRRPRALQVAIVCAFEIRLKEGRVSGRPRGLPATIGRLAIPDLRCSVPSAASAQRSDAALVLSPLSSLTFYAIRIYAERKRPLLRLLAKYCT